MSCWEFTPRLAFLSAERRSGKTRALEVTALLVPNAVQAVNVTPAYLFRKVGDQENPPTILYDEVDTLFGSKVTDTGEIRALLKCRPSPWRRHWTLHHHRQANRDGGNSRLLRRRACGHW